MEIIIALLSFAVFIYMIIILVVMQKCRDLEKTIIEMNEEYMRLLDVETHERKEADITMSHHFADLFARMGRAVKKITPKNDMKND